MPEVSVKSPNENPQVFGHDSIKESIIESFKQGKLHHALLLSGNKGTGKATLAYHLAYYILKSENIEKIDNTTDSGFNLFGEPEKAPTSELDIDENDLAYSKIKAGSHPDLMVIGIEVDEKTHKLHKEITVESVRKIKNFLNLTPAISSYRIVIIDSADEMNTNAANALLKALEEPPHNTFLFLISHNPNKLIDTILSRCQQIKIPALNYDTWLKALEASSNLQQLGNVDFRLLSKLSNNSVSIALDILSSEGINLYHNVIKALNNDNLTEIYKLSDSITASEASWSCFPYIVNLLINRAVKLKVTNKIEFSISNMETILLNKIVRQHYADDLFQHLDDFNKLVSDVTRININKKQVAVNIFSRLLNHNI